MGSSIAVAISKLGLPIKLIDKQPAALESGLQRIDKMFAALERKSQEDKEFKINATNISDAQSRRLLIQPTNNFDDFRDIDLVIEAVNEDLETKKSIFQMIDKICPQKTIFASNTSSFSITQLASFTNRPEQIIGMHFFNPAHIMALVEIIPGLNTSTEVVTTAIDFVRRLDKLPIKVEECASFLVNRLLGRYINEAIWILQSGLADAKTIDDAACQTLMPVGPLQLRDMNGLDIGLSVARFNYEEYGERFKPAPLLALMVERKMLGKKTGSGFYTYIESERKPQSINAKLPELISLNEKQNTERLANLPEFEPIQLFLPMINEAFYLLQEKIVSAQDIDPALKAGLGMKKGLLEYAFDLGLNNCLNKIENLHKTYGERFRPAPLLKRYVWANKNSL
jgi:3-hydroxyacyl-CoA dehydrogenase